MIILALPKAKPARVAVRVSSLIESLSLVDSSESHLYMQADPVTGAPIEAHAIPMGRPQGNLPVCGNGCYGAELDGYNEGRWCLHHWNSVCSSHIIILADLENV